MAAKFVTLYLFTQSLNTILNILSNFIPHEILTCDEKDSPWFNKKLKEIIQEQNSACKAYRNNSSNTPEESSSLFK